MTRLSSLVNMRIEKFFLLLFILMDTSEKFNGSILLIFIYRFPIYLNKYFFLVYIFRLRVIKKLIQYLYKRILIFNL